MKLLEEFVKRLYIVIILEYLVRKLVQGTIKKTIWFVFFSKSVDKNNKVHSRDGCVI
jgi:hypothetical protein